MKRIPPKELNPGNVFQMPQGNDKFFDELEEKKEISDAIFNINTENIEEVKNEYCIDLYDPFVLNNIKRKCYVVGGIFQTEEFIHDLMRVFAYIDTANSFYLLKEWKENSNICDLKQVNEVTMKKKLKKIKFTIENIFFSAWEVINYGKNIDFFHYNQTTFYSKDPGYFSRFRGFPFKPPEEYNENAITLFISHLLNVICNGDKELCKYICNWFAHIFQKPGEKIGIALVLVGMQGTGKTVFTNVVCRLCGSYGLENANLKNISGKYNTLLKDKILVVANEIDPKYGHESSSANNLKTLITEKSIDINSKHKDAVIGSNFANFILVSNNFVPIRIDPDDRRYCVLEVSPEHANDKEYFDQLCSSIEAPGFYENLMKFFLNINIDNWNPSEIPYTEAKERIIRECNDGFDMKEEQENNDNSKPRIGRQEFYEQYKKWAIEHDKEVVNQHSFKRIVMESCKIAHSGKRKYYELKYSEEDPLLSPLPPPPFQLIPPPSPPPVPQKYEEEEDFPFQEDFEPPNQDDDDDNHNDDNHNDDDDEIFF